MESYETKRMHCSVCGYESEHIKGTCRYYCATCGAHNLDKSLCNDKCGRKCTVKVTNEK